MAAPGDHEISPVAAVRANGVAKQVQDAAFNFYEAITAAALSSRKVRITANEVQSVYENF